MNTANILMQKYIYKYIQKYQGAHNRDASFKQEQDDENVGVQNIKGAHFVSKILGVWLEKKYFHVHLSVSI